MRAVCLFKEGRLILQDRTERNLVMMESFNTNRLTDLLNSSLQVDNYEFTESGCVYFKQKSK